MMYPNRRPSIGERIRIALLAAIGVILLSLAAGCAGARQAPPAGAAADADDAAGAADAESARDAAAGEAGAPGYVPADAEFMRDMLVHHAQALEMTGLVPERTDSEAMRLLARRIDETQVYEMGLMREWLKERDEPVPSPEEALGPHGGHAGHGGPAGMAGMASPEQMAALAAAEDEAFERLFLELMIRHHEGALVMVDELLDQEGAGQEPELFFLLSHVDVDQRAEIARMRRMLNEYPSGEKG